MMNLLNRIGMLLAENANNLPEGFEWVQQIVDAIDIVLWPLLIVVAAAGTIYAIVIGVTMAKADSTEKREEAKKRLINVIIGIAVTIALILFFKLLISVILPAFFKKGENPDNYFKLFR